MAYRPDAWALAVLAAALIAAAVRDVRTGTIPNAITYPAILAGLIGQAVFGGADGLAAALGGLAVGFGPLLILWLLGGIGGGDAKLMGAVGALSNWRFALASLALAFAAAAVMAVVVMIRNRIIRLTLQRIGLTLWLSVLGGRADDVVPGGATVPFALAVALAAAAAWLDALLGGPISTAMGAR
ncbi:MAG: hypothetical protein GX591_12320 [Planctomycetes bacterium]|nr:hypothetical protein [Planctomycetota bacterium]